MVRTIIEEGSNIWTPIFEKDEKKIKEELQNVSSMTTFQIINQDGLTITY